MNTEVPQGFYFRESDHAYFLDGKKMTGCTTILGVIAKPMLIGWAARMATEYIKEAKVWELVPNTPRKIMIGDKEFDELLEEARNAHTKKKEDAGQKGTDLHETAEEWIKWCIELNKGNAIKPDMGKDSEWKIIKPLVNWAIENKVKFLATEKQYYSKSLFVAGTADLIFEKDGKRYVGDIKTYAKIWDRIPFFQCAGYALMAEEMGEPKFDGYCILRLGKDGSFEEMWSFDTEGDTRAFKACVELYRQLKLFKSK